MAEIWIDKILNNEFRDLEYIIATSQQMRNTRFLVHKRIKTPMNLNVCNIGNLLYLKKEIVTFINIAFKFAGGRVSEIHC